MSKVSIIIPSRNENLLVRTVNDIFAKAAGEIEVIVVVDGPTSYPLPKERPNLTLLTKPEEKGLRSGTNNAARVATGKYLLKLDAHCMLAEGFDEALKADCDSDWIVVPRLYTLDYDNWEPTPETGVDYYYLSCPWTHHRFFQMQSSFWINFWNTGTRATQYPRPLVDEIMAFQGSAWFMTAKYWQNHIEGLEESTFGPYCEHQEISLKTWLGGGKVMVNKKTWYAHDHRDNLRRGYHRAISEFHFSHVMVAQYFVNNRWPKRVHDFSWLVDRFWPLPTKETLGEEEKFFWPEDWRKYTS